MRARCVARCRGRHPGAPAGNGSAAGIARSVRIAAAVLILGCAPRLLLDPIIAAVAASGL